jgi:protein-S-isoprenylcysteine O-methyltransferase Ste14
MLGPLLKTLLFTILVPGTVAGYIPLFLLDRDLRVWKSPLAAIGWMLIVVGAGIYLVCAFDFSVTGRGTPAPIDAPKRLVSGRLYRITRNPMYVGVLSVIAGEGIIFKSSAIGKYWLVVAIFFHLFVLLYEEPTLREKFGESYREYCRQVPRWISPIRRR